MCQGTILTVPILCHLFAFSGEEGQEGCETNGGSLTKMKSLLLNVLCGL